ncbi:hypothetical protein VM1G_11432 [Cytospora mali]|uniref:Protein kinase domain-containing protein n=1 Tax=Cytospora mali TaxID=578113 RepID=A0A194VQ72_CYTMA|nr:hypothetical protein VM1G_11432 [Valsa mali]
MANPNNYPPKTADLLFVQQITQDLFHHVRTNGDSSWNADDPAQEARISARSQPVANLVLPFQLPLPGSPAANAIRRAGVRNRGTRLDDKAQFNPAAPNPDISSDNKKFSKATLNDKTFRRRMRAAGIAFVKQLGWGGNAAATLWGFSDATGTTNNVVLKSRYDNPFSMVSMINEKQKLDLGDFGNACAGADLGLPAPGFDDLDDIWRARQLGKNGWFIPEQFTAEWDYVNYEPYSEGLTDIGAGTGTAGLFSERSNIFAIGLTMRCCITRSEPDCPPHPTPVPPRGPQMGTQGYTYGGELRMRFFTGRFGRDLCHLVSQCLMHRPSDRPSLDRLRHDIAAGVAANPLSPDDRQWGTQHLAPGVLAVLLHLSAEKDF